jgi:hypothetical protein
MMGELSLLNVGTGDTKIRFEEDASEEDKINNAKLLKDMIRRGYAILVEVGKDDKGPLYRRAYDYDGETHEYIVAGLPEDVAEGTIQEEQNAPAKERKADSLGRVAGKGPRSRKSRGPYATKRVKATGAKAVAVPRTAGG